MNNQTIKLIQGSLLVAGTSVGGGMLALPVLTSLGGFIPSLVIYFLCWAFMASTGLLFLEISTWLKKDANIISMASKTLGSGGKWFAWIIYLFLFYCLTLAYIVGTGNLFVELSQQQLSQVEASLLFLCIFAPFVYLGTNVVSHLNFWLMIGLGISYLGFVVLGFPHISLQLLSYKDWSLSLMALPVSFTAFAYQGIIPTLFNYMEHDVKRTKQVILIGSFTPLIIYIIWQMLILGIVPAYGPGGLKEALELGNNAIYPLKNFLDSPFLYYLGQSFAFFALVTSFFGVTLGLMDFLSDGLKVKKTYKGKLLLCLLIFAPPFVLSIFYPHVFLIALDYAGGIGCALLLGLLPILMAWKGRYILKLGNQPLLKGGKTILGLLFLFVIFELLCEIAYHFVK
ncbi:Tyrosine permease [Candidatus Rubidus massiliensis]|nr:MAG: tyrosine transporter [Chlamydia sp. 32-24]CDZ80066.1 Tyrosine permease [Candidatus Rubidus massiliensis]